MSSPALWDSWTDDAIIRDRAAGKWLDLSKQRFMGHEGKYLKVGGPLNVPALAAGASRARCRPAHRGPDAISPHASPTSCSLRAR